MTTPIEVINREINVSMKSIKKSMYISELAANVQIFCHTLIDTIYFLESILLTELN